MSSSGITEKWYNQTWKDTVSKGYRLSLLIPFYNKLPELRLVLASCESQSLKDFEIVICDDGSSLENTEKLKQEFANSPLAIQWIWHRDLGFRKNRILNHGILIAQSDYLVFIDGDMVLHPEFLREHDLHRSANHVLSGRSPEFTPGLTASLTPEKIRQGYIEKNIFWIMISILWQKHSNGIKGLYFKNEFLRKFFNRKPRPLVGRSFSLTKANLEKINGFNMHYEGVGIGEDSDIDYRLSLAGVKTKPLTNIAVQYHLYHKTKPRENNNHLIFQEVVSKQEMATSYGLRELQKEIELAQEYAMRAQL